MSAVLKPYEVHPAFASILRTMCPPAKSKPTYEQLAANNMEMCAEVERNARDAFATSLDTQDEFEEAWFSEDGKSYARWKECKRAAEQALAGVRS